jgi:hypothetical protein
LDAEPEEDIIVSIDSDVATARRENHWLVSVSAVLEDNNVTKFSAT